MVANARGRDTGPELALRRELHRRGLRYRVDWPLPGMPRRRADIAFTRARVAVFVDGCFWHGCEQHGRSTKSNTDFWKAKVQRNRERDRGTDALLRAQGWSVVRIWEHEPVVEAANRVHEMVVGGLGSENEAERWPGE